MSALLLAEDEETTGYRKQPLLSRLVDALLASGYEGEAVDDASTRLLASTDNSIYQLLPPLVLFPRTQEDVERIAGVAANPEFADVAFTARGGGTGTNGQALTESVVVDMSRHLNRILEVDEDRGVVRVEPGVVLAQLNSHLARYDLFFPPMISTASRATLGGMIGTDACGKGSRRYGRTHDYVEALKVSLPSGETLELHSLAAEEVDAGAANDRQAVLAAGLRETVAPHRDDVTRTFPDMPRSLTGYNLRDAFPADGSVHLQRLFTGAEGTLGFVSQATLRVIPRPKHRQLVVVRYETFEAALADARTLLATEPSAIETLDERVSRLARQDSAWFRVRRAMAGDGDTPLPVNFVEYEGTDEDVLESCLSRLEEELAHSGRSIGTYRCMDEAETSELWGVRSRSVGLLARTEGTRKPIPFVEDTVVPPERLPEYIAELRGLLDSYGIEYGMFGHVDVGCLHVRPALDMTDASDARLVREITEQVVRLLKRHQGILWGEHGKGFRGEYTREFFGAELYPLLATVKRTFDPHNRMNPGKIVAPDGDPERIRRIDAVPLRGERDRRIPLDVRSGWEKAIACNGNGVCFDWDARQAICPSYKVTRDRTHSPKGRATLVREWLRQLSEQGHHPEGIVERTPRLSRRRAPADISHAVYDAMQGCLGCKACATQCPVHVSIPAMRARFLQSYHRHYRRPVRDYAAGWLEHLAPLAAAVAPLANAVAGSATGRAVMRRAGISDLPALSRDHGLRRARRLGFPVVGTDELQTLPEETLQQAVFIRPDAFTTYFDPPVLPAVCRVAAATGARPVAMRHAPTGKALHVHGFLEAFDEVARREARRVSALAAFGRPIVGVDPSSTLMYRDEYPAALSEEAWSRPRLLQQWLNDMNLPGDVPAAPSASYRLILHCTERTAHPESARQWQKVFERLGLELEVVETGCCGMAGIYGHQCEHREHSRELYDMSWREATESLPPERVLATGYSCRSQVLRESGFRPAHPIEVIADHLERRGGQS